MDSFQQYDNVEMLAVENIGKGQLPKLFFLEYSHFIVHMIYHSPKFSPPNNLNTYYCIAPIPWSKHFVIFVKYTIIMKIFGTKITTPVG